MDEDSDAVPARVVAEGVELWIHVRPGGHRNAVEGRFDGVLAVRVAAAPTKGQANEAVERTVADALHVRSSAVSVVSGPTSRRKKLLVRGESARLMTSVQVLLDDGR